MFVSDDEEEDWPDFSEDHKTKYIPPTPVNGGTDSSTQKRFAVRKKSDSVMYNMGVILAAVAAGFDIRISNTSAIHPNLHSVEEEKSMKKRDSFILNRRDAYLGAVRDSFIEPEGNFNNHNYSNASGFRHTYHGVQTRQRPSIQNFEVPMHFTEKDDSPGSQTSSTTGSKSSPQRLSYTESDSTVTSDRSSILQRQISDSSNYESTASSQAPQRRSVTFEDDFAPDYRDYKNTPTYTHKRTPSNTSNSSNTPQDYEPRSYRQADSYGVQPMPPRRKPTGEPAQRPTTLEVGPKIRQPPVPPPKKYTNSAPSGARDSPHFAAASSRDGSWDSPRHRANTQEPFSENSHYHSARSQMSPGNTPPHIRHQKTLLDIDVEGQSQDKREPLVKPKPVITRPTAKELEKEFVWQ